MGDDERGKTWLAGDGLAFPSTTLIAWLYYSEKSGGAMKEVGHGCNEWCLLVEIH